MWNLKNTDELIYKTETDLWAQKRNLWLPKQKVGGKDKLGIQDQQIQTIICKIDKQEGPLIQRRKLYSVSSNGKEY